MTAEAAPKLKRYRPVPRREITTPENGATVMLGLGLVGLIAGAMVQSTPIVLASSGLLWCARWIQDNVHRQLGPIYEWKEDSDG